MNFSEKRNFIFERADECVTVGGRVESCVTFATLNWTFSNL